MKYSVTVSLFCSFEDFCGFISRNNYFLRGLEMNSVVSFHFTSANVKHNNKAFKAPKALLSVAIPPRLFYSPTLATSESPSRLGCFLVLRKNHSFSENLFNFWLTFRLIDYLQGRIMWLGSQQWIKQSHNVPCVPWVWGEELWWGHSAQAGWFSQKQ